MRLPFLFRSISRDLPLERDETARFLPWIVAFIVFLAALSLAATMVVGELVASWDRGLSSTVTVQVLPPQEGGDAAFKQRVDQVVGRLRQVPGVTHADPVPPAKVAALLEPWLGGGAEIAGLPLPALIDVGMSDPRAVDLDALAQDLRRISPGVSVDSHRVWLDNLISRVRVAQAIAIGVVLLNALAAVATVIFAARTGLVVHSGVIEVLHLMGATDGYIARQFARQALRLGLRGGLIGIVPAILALVLVTHVGRGWAGGEFGGWLGPDIALRPIQWAALLLVPVATALIAVVTARRTVLAMLEKLP